MNIEIFALCDAATQSEGKLNMLGAFDALHLKQVPATHPHCAVALRVRFSRIEQGQHSIKINVVDEDGNPLIQSVEGRMSVKVGPEATSTCVNLILGIMRLKIEKYGPYSVDLAIDGRQEASLPLSVKEFKKPG